MSIDQWLLWPFNAADMNLLKIPDEGPDEKYVLLSDILPTAWHANEMGEVKEGDVVAIWCEKHFACHSQN